MEHMFHAVDRNVAGPNSRDRADYRSPARGGASPAPAHGRFSRGGIDNRA
jgi:hypothetical protein